MKSSDEMTQASEGRKKIPIYKFNTPEELETFVLTKFDKYKNTLSPLFSLIKNNECTYEDAVAILKSSYTRVDASNDGRQITHYYKQYINLCNNTPHNDDAVSLFGDIDEA